MSENIIAIELDSYKATGSRETVRGMYGSMGVMDWRQIMLNRGFGWIVKVGDLDDTVIQGGGAGTTFDLDQPEVMFSVPATHHFIPLRFDTQLQAPLIAADNNKIDILIAVDKDVAVASTDGTSTAETPINLKDANGITSCPVAVQSAYTADLTDPTLDFDLARETFNADVQGTAANALWHRARLLYEPVVAPIIKGPATVLIYWGGTVATSGFGQYAFLAIPDSLAEDFN